VCCVAFPSVVAKKLACCSLVFPASDVLTGVVLAKLSSSVFNYKPSEIWGPRKGRGMMAGGGELRLLFLRAAVELQVT